MVFVDTSVWIDLFKGADTPVAVRLSRLLETEETIAYTGIILQEIFQGVSSKRHRNDIENCFAVFIELFPQRSTYKKAAHLFRKARANGHPIRSSVDCLIAACCIENHCSLLHKDRDFKFIAKVSNLALVNF